MALDIALCMHGVKSIMFRIDMLDRKRAATEMINSMSINS